MIPRPVLGAIGRLVAFLALVEAATFWVSSRIFLSPIQRHYIGAYLLSSLPALAPPMVEVSWIWKTGPGGKRELASEDDALPADGAIGMELSAAALEAGWTDLREGDPELVPRIRLKGVLADLALDSRSFWPGVLMAGSFGFVLFYYALSGLEWLADKLPELPWRRTRFPWENPPPSAFERIAARAQRIRSQLAALHCTAQPSVATHPVASTATNARTELIAKPKTFALPLFGIHTGTATNGYVWSKKDEIE